MRGVIMDSSQIQSRLDAMEADTTLLDETNLDDRARALLALDQVDAFVRLRGRWQDLGAMQARAIALRRRLTEIDALLFAGLRAGIRGGSLRGPALRRRLDLFTGYRPGLPDRPQTGYDDLDALLRGLLGLDDPPAVGATRDADVIGLEFTPARVVLALVDHLALGRDDVLFDLGSGLGQVVILVHLLTGARARGVELEPAYCRFARERADELGLADVTFLNADTRHADLSDGTVFFMSTPFRGQLLDLVLARLREASQGRRIRLCTYGPCMPRVAQEPWLRAVVGGDAAFRREAYRLAVFVGE